MIQRRYSQFGARLGLLAMWLLLGAPLLSQGLLANAPLDQPGLPSWLGELTCSSTHDAQPPRAPLPPDQPWAKCGYCTLLLSSPALSPNAVAISPLPPGVGAPLQALRVGPPPQARPFPAAHPRAPPLSLS